MIFGVVVAGGVGSRMNISDMPKQFLPLGEKPIVIHTLEKFLLNQRFDIVYVGVHPDWMTYMQDLTRHFNLDGERLRLVPGGADRNLTILNVIESIEKEFGAKDEHIIVTHDAVRPFITMRIIDDNIDAAIKYGACDTAVAATDTIVESEKGDFIKSIPDRRKMYQGQTPQSFKMELLKNLYTSLSEEEKSLPTDACKICVFRSQPVYIVEGDVSNIKITTVSDYKIAQAMLGGIKLD